MRAKKRKTFAHNSSDSKLKGKVVTEEGKEVFLSRTKRLRCQWPGCEALFRDRGFRTRFYNFFPIQELIYNLVLQLTFQSFLLFMNE